ncbi:MAG: CvpA family protein, partial [Clostridia bacterium]|nr:CvpA family protein [Clostridia bacterium]
MNYISLGLLVLTALFVGFGALWGLIRGRNRAILRLVIIVLCLVVALAARGTVVNMLMDIDTGDGTLREMLVATLSEGEMALPDSIQNLVFALIEIIAGLMVFLLSFIVLGIVSMLLFWILKIFVKKGEKKRAGAGALVGAVQGALVAFVICSPITGLFVQANKLASLDFEIAEGQTISDVFAPLGLEEATQTGIGKFYDTTGGWFFDMLTTTKDESGKEVSLEGTFDVVTTVVGVADTFTGVTDSLDALTKEDATLTERVDAMDALGQAFKDMGNSMDSLTPESKQMINDVVSSVAEMFVGEEMPEGVAEFLEDFDIEQIDFVAIVDAMQGMASYIGGMEDETA